GEEYLLEVKVIEDPELRAQRQPVVNAGCYSLVMPDALPNNQLTPATTHIRATASCGVVDIDDGVSQFIGQDHAGLIRIELVAEVSILYKEEPLKPCLFQPWAYDAVHPSPYGGNILIRLLHVEMLH